MVKISCQENYSTTENLIRYCWIHLHMVPVREFHIPADFVKHFRLYYQQALLYMHAYGKTKSSEKLHLPSRHNYSTIKLTGIAQQMHD